MQSISRFLAVLIALVFLIGSLAGVASAHSIADGGDHTAADYATLTLTRQDGLGATVHVGQTLQFGWTYTDVADHRPATGSEVTSIALMGSLNPTAITVNPANAGRTFEYPVPEEDLDGGTSRTVTLYLEYEHTPDPADDADSTLENVQPHPARTITSNSITFTVLPALRTDAGLTALSLSDITLDPAFDVTTNRYPATNEFTVGNDVTETTITATVDMGGTYEVQKRTSGTEADPTFGDPIDGAVSLDVGVNQIRITVKAENGENAATNPTYDVFVARMGEPIMDGVEVSFMADIPEGDDLAVDGTVTFSVTITTSDYGIAVNTTPYTITVRRYRGDFVISEATANTGSNLPRVPSNGQVTFVPGPYTLVAADVADDVDRLEFEFNTTLMDATFGFTDATPGSGNMARYTDRGVSVKSGETSTMPAAPASAPASSPAPAPAPAPVSAPAMAGPPAPLGEIGRSSSAIATVLAGDVLLIDRTDGGADLRIGIGWTATDDSSQVLVGFIRDAGLGQTYAVVRREDDGMVVRRWIEPDSADVYLVPWADVNANYTVPTDVIITIPLDERHPAQLMLARRFDGGDDRIFVHVGNGVWSHIPDYNTFIARGFLWRNVTAADSDFFNRINEGPALPSSGG